MRPNIRMINVLFIGCAYSEAQKGQYLSKSIRGYQFAAQNYQEALLKGFIANGVSPYVVTVPSLSTFPMGYKSPIVKSSAYDFLGLTMGKSIGFINLPFLNTCFFGFHKAVYDWAKRVNGSKYVVVYGVHSHLMKAAIRITQKYDNVKLCLIAPDLPKFMACNRFYAKLGMKKRDMKRINHMLPSFDGVVALSQAMIKELGFTNKPSIVVEGIYSDDGRQPDRLPQDNKVMMYSGSLSLRYGIGDLVDSFMKLSDPSFRLWLCGTGDAVPYILECKNKDKRIEYFGVLAKDEVIRLQLKATLLVNPRHKNEEFTKFSFPSKTLEYMASGIPTVMSHLECIPPEYDEYLYYFEDETVDGIADTLRRLCLKDNVEQKLKGQKAREFVLTQKNAESQAKRVLDLLKQL